MYANTSKIKECFNYFHLDISGIVSDFSEDITSLHMAIYYTWWTPPKNLSYFIETIHSSLPVEYACCALSVSSQDLAMKVLLQRMIFKNAFLLSVLGTRVLMSFEIWISKISSLKSCLTASWHLFLVQGCLHLHHDDHPWWILSLPFSLSAFPIKHTHTEASGKKEISSLQTSWIYQW